ncbi:Werner Syndrome-like exonuclease [Telopea speciosissima]|uniref:Werner Syndrome-like exonuclease n=1 Tax=Telopea speciosissima TaxID=54955 RepID=UPI001CC41164|nr:Werner Syndrome-like exonuclease [Telopea speciosissima]
MLKIVVYAIIRLLTKVVTASGPIPSMENKPWVEDGGAGRSNEEDRNWEINGEQSSDWESQIHHEPQPTSSWSPCLPDPNRIEQTETASTAIHIEDIEEDCPSNDRQIYCVTFFGEQIRTTLAYTASVVDDWIADIQRIHHQRIDQKQLVVGLDIEWRPSFSRSVEYKVAILQLCVERTCLVFQLLYADHIPNSLIDFLKNPNLRFVGVGIEGDVEKLLEDHELNVLNNLNLRSLAAKRLSMPELKSFGLKELTREVLGKEIGKPKKVTMSRWDAEWLTYDQVQYVCLDAFLSFKIGKSLIMDCPVP